MPVNLYMNVTGFLFANNFAADLGIGTTPAVSSITNVTITVTSPDIFSSQGTYNESAATFQILAPKPSSMFLLGLAMLAMGAPSFRRSCARRRRDR